MSSNPLNARPSKAVTRTIENLAHGVGGRVRWENGGAHFRAFIDLPTGPTAQMTISRGARDAVLLRGWFRQALRRAGFTEVAR